MPLSEIRRLDRRGTSAEAMDLVAKARFGHLGTVTEDGYPYVIPVYHAVVDGRIVFHGGPRGHKLANIARDHRVCFETASFIGDVQNDRLCDWDAKYESAVIFGRAEAVTDPAAKMAALEAIAQKYAGRSGPLAQRDVATVAVVAITVESASFKRG